MEKKIYIVTAGFYSDYGIQAVFSNIEKAKEFIDANGNEESWRIEEYNIDEESIKYKTSQYEVHVHIVSDEVRVVCKFNLECDDIDCFQYNGDDFIKLWIASDSIARAKRVALERWFQIKALKETAFDKMFERVVKEYGLLTYPKYNFYTKEIILKDGEKLL